MKDPHRHRYPRGEQITQRLRRYTRGLYWILFPVLGLLLLQAWNLQVIHGSYYRQLAENNRIRVVPVFPTRGWIYDRHGHLLARNTPSFSVGLILEDVKDLPQTLAQLAPWLGTTPEALSRRVQALRGIPPYTPLILKERLSLEEVARIRAHLGDLPGVTIEVEALREYPQRRLAAHVLGYVGEISAQELRSPAFAGEVPGRLVGKAGIERAYDALLRGELGYREIEVDALGHERRQLGLTPPVTGKDLILTLDLELQRVAEEALGGHRGVVIAMDPRNGDILALVSHPAYDPNLLSGRLTLPLWKQISRDPASPLTNRAIQGLYPPGSIFKIVLALGALEEGRISPRQRLFCPGRYPLGGRIFRDWKAEGHGWIDLRMALIESCDVYFYQVGAQMDVDQIAQYAWALGLGTPTGIDLPGEKAGLVPTRSWKRKRFREVWYPGETLILSIGQGYLLVTPLQQTLLMAAVANGGTFYRPRLVWKIREENREYTFPPVIQGRLPFSSRHLRIVQDALRGVVSHPRGTGSAAQSALTSIAGKTGTAQVVSLPPEGAKAEASPRVEDHAWFVGYAPFRQPRIVVTVLVEHGGHGGASAAPIARKVIEAHLQAQGRPPG